jgi:hypothetical protein
MCVETPIDCALLLIHRNAVWSSWVEILVFWKVSEVIRAGYLPVHPRGTQIRRTNNTALWLLMLGRSRYACSLVSELNDLTSGSFNSSTLPPLVSLHGCSNRLLEFLLPVFHKTTSTPRDQIKNSFTTTRSMVLLIGEASVKAENCFL